MNHRKYLKEAVIDSSKFTVISELTGGPGYNFSPFEKFLKGYQEKKDSIPAGFHFAGITIPQNPGGVANIDPTDAQAVIEQKDLLGDLDYIPHLSCKDNNTDSLISSLVGYRQRGIKSVLALTGDKPVSAQGVFEVESVGLLSLMTKMNNAALMKAKPGQWDNLSQFCGGAAVSPFKYTESSLMQQYYKMEKKIMAGAKFLITQVGWDWKKSLELMQYMKDNHINTPIFGNVYWLTTLTPAPRLMHDIKLPGCFVSDDLLAKLNAETVDEHIDRAAQQVAMYKTLGYAGVDLGGVHDFDVFLKILNRAAEIGENWEQFKDNLYWPAESAFYLYEDSGKMARLSKSKKKFNERFFDFMHRAILDSKYFGFHCFKRAVKLFRANKEDVFTYKAFYAIEKVLKYWTFECEECGDTINNPRISALEHTSSLVNYLFGNDHTMKTPLIGIGESIHASIPKTGKIMIELHGLGPNAYTKPSGPLDYVRALIEDQADKGASYIAVNLDAFGENDVQRTVTMMVEYTKLVRKWGKGVPICVDSSNDDVLVTGLKEWYNTDETIKPPLLNSIKIHTADKMMPLKKEYDFSFIGLLVSEDKPTGSGGSHSVEELYELAKQIFNKAMQYGFKPTEIFFDSTVFPIAIDMPMKPGVPGYTYRAFETIKKIKADPKMKDCHFSLGVSNSCRDLPVRKIGICRAYVAKAIECGLDAGIVNTSHQYGLKDPDLDLLKLINAYAALDGTPDRLNEAMMLMGQFCASVRKPT
ncbi:MAG: methylenetetrahydrofolate reductase [Planctomycetota bacterium]|jgi:methylenetetrahydrofolate reductase (NADPH)